jgi:hypothetical protein
MNSSLDATTCINDCAAYGVRCDVSIVRAKNALGTLPIAPNIPSATTASTFGVLVAVIADCNVYALTSRWLTRLWSSRSAILVCRYTQFNSLPASCSDHKVANREAAGCPLIANPMCNAASVGPLKDDDYICYGL